MQEHKVVSFSTAVPRGSSFGSATAKYDPKHVVDAANWLAGPAGFLGEMQWYRVVGTGELPIASIAGQPEVIIFNSYSYLGLSHHPEVREAAKMAVDKYGTSACGVRPVSGSRDLHVELETTIADWLGKEAAIVFSTGYGANESGIAALVGPEDLIIADRYSHRSMRKGFELSGATTMFFEHNDLADLETKLRASEGDARNVLVCIEGVYSMHGTIPDLVAITNVTRRYGCLLYVDEAHSVGALGDRGAGICEHTGTDPKDAFVLMGSLSKAIPSIGGYVASDSEVVAMLRFSSSQTIFSAANTPADTAAALAAIRIIQTEPEHGHRLRRNVSYLSRKLNEVGFDVAAENESPVIPLIFAGDNKSAFDFWKKCLAKGIALNTFYFPVVPKGAFLARIGVMATHEEQHLDHLVSTLCDSSANLLEEGLP